MDILIGRFGDVVDWIEAHKMISLSFLIIAIPLIIGAKRAFDCAASDFHDFSGAALTYCAIGLSAYLNFAFGSGVDYVIGGMLIIFSCGEVWFHTAKYKLPKKSKLRKLCSLIFIFLLCISAFAAYLSYTKYSQVDENEFRGVNSTIDSKKYSLELAKANAKTASDAARVAADACALENQRHAQDRKSGYVSKRCKESDAAQVKAQQASARVSQISEDLNQYRNSLENPNSAGVDFISRISGLSPESVNNFFLGLCVLFVVTLGSAFIAVRQAIRENKNSPAPEEKGKKSASGSVFGRLKGLASRKINNPGDDDGGGPKGGGKKPVQTKKPQSKPVAARIPSNVTPIGSSKRSRPKTQALSDKEEKSKFEKDVERAARLVSQEKLKPTLNSLTSKKAKRLGLKVGRATAKSMVESIKSNQSCKEGGVSE